MTPATNTLGTMMEPKSIYIFIYQKIVSKWPIFVLILSHWIYKGVVPMYQVSFFKIRSFCVVDLWEVWRQKIFCSPIKHGHYFLFFVCCLHGVLLSIVKITRTPFFYLYVLLFFILVNLYESEGGKTNVIGSTDKDQKKGYVLWMTCKLYHKFYCAC